MSKLDIKVILGVLTEKIRNAGSCRTGSGSEQVMDRVSKGYIMGIAKQDLTLNMVEIEYE